MNALQARPPQLIALPKLPQMLFSFEALFVLFLFAGRYKTDARLAWVPVDLTALFYVLSLAMGSCILLSRFLAIFHKRVVFFVLSTLLLALWVMLSLLWTSGSAYAFQKTFYFDTLVLWAAIAPALIIAPDPDRMQRFFTLVFVFAAWTLVESILLFARQGGVGFIRAFGANYLALGTTLGLGSIIVFVNYLYHVGRLGARMSYAVYLCASLLMMAAGGGRGPLLCLGATFSVVTVLILVKKIRGHSMLPAKRIATLSFFLVVGGLAVATAVVDLRHMQTIRRIETLLTEQSGGGSARIRLAHYHRAWEYWQLSPLVGHGIGSYPTLRLGFDTRDYPHNIILELMVETGLVGLTMFFLLLFSGFKSYRAVLAKPTSFGIGAFLMTVFFLLFSQFSGDITDNRFLFMSLGFFSGTGSNHHASTAE